jgi:predicted PurR-regulated permease PerM
MQHPRKSRRGTSAVLGVLLLVLVCFAFGIVFFGFVNTNISSAVSNFNTQMVGLLVKSFSINATHIVAYLQNAGNQMIELTNAYVNGLLASLTAMVKITPNAIGEAVLQGNFLPGNTYTVKLASIFNTEISFQASF